MKYTIGGEHNITEAELKSKSKKIASAIITKKKVELTLTSRLTNTEEINLSTFITTKKKDIKAQFAAANNTDKLDMLAKRAGLS